jgi:isopentenyl-diphosphate delta-isomerase
VAGVHAGGDARREPSDDGERVVLVDAQDRELGSEAKLRAHEDGGRLHRAFSVFVFDSRGRTLLQRRADGKYHFGGLWTNSCCGHPRPGESVTDAASRRLREEMGIAVTLVDVGSFIYRARDPQSGLTEHELDHVCVGAYDGDVQPDPAEAGDFRWVTPDELDAALASAPEAHTPWLPQAWTTARARQKR